MASFLLYPELNCKLVQMDDRFETVHIWNEELAIENAGRWTPRQVVKIEDLGLNGVVGEIVSTEDLHNVEVVFENEGKGLYCLVEGCKECDRANIKLVVKEPRVISVWMHNAWGNSIFFLDWERRRVSGHLKEIPEEGDILRAKMDSGKIARFQFVEVKRMHDPRDMFFATVSDLEYEVEGCK